MIIDAYDCANCNPDESKVECDGCGDEFCFRCWKELTGDTEDEAIAKDTHYCSKRCAEEY